MPLYHGTSAENALKMLQTKILPSKDGFFYCFNSEKPESMAGALCFATGSGLRKGSLKEAPFINRYIELNPDFPTGIKGAFAKNMLIVAGTAWAKDQLRSASAPLGHCPAILVFQSHKNAIDVARSGFINEVRVPTAALSSLILDCVYLDDSLLSLPEVTALKQKGIRIEPISACVNQVFPQAPRKTPGGPKSG